MTETPLLLHFPAPFGWMAFTTEQLAAACTLARSLLPKDNDLKIALTNETSRSLLDATEAARVLKVDASWLMRGARERRIPFVRFGKHVRFDPQELIALFHVSPTQTGPSAGG